MMQFYLLPDDGSEWIAGEPEPLTVIDRVIPGRKEPPLCIRTEALFYPGSWRTTRWIGIAIFETVYQVR